MSEIMLGAVIVLLLLNMLITISLARTEAE
jgi:hypothetical protein